MIHVHAVMVQEPFMWYLVRSLAGVKYSFTEDVALKVTCAIRGCSLLDKFINIFVKGLCLKPIMEY